MEIDNHKHNTGFMVIAKKYKLSFFGASPRHDWTMVFLFGFVLILISSSLYYFDSQNIKKSISGDALIREEKTYFDIEKAKNLITDFKKRIGQVDQSL
jgi:hypothetical protein